MEFMLGCNYWASNAGTEMWGKYDSEVIREDISLLVKYGIKYLRVFPIWSDFQPVKTCYTINGKRKEYRMENDSFPTNPYFLDEEMIERFEDFCSICEECGIKLIVGILTGWMSGRVFIPHALDGKNLFTDPVALLIEQKFIKGFVQHFNNVACIYAWDLGNECDAMSSFGTVEQVENWVSIITNAIKAVDSKRPVLSGMANPEPDNGYENNWMAYQGEILDMVTTHPYPMFHPHSFSDYIASFKTTLHGTAQAKYFADLSGKPCLAEEVGTLGNSVCDDETAALFLKANLFSGWANGGMGLLWWCAFDFTKLPNAPYTWSHMENELGLVSEDKKAKKTLKIIKEFSEFLDELDFDLPPAREDVVCIIPESYEPWEAWGLAYTVYILAEQAKLHIKFAYANKKLPDSKAYILPSVKGDTAIRKEQYWELFEKVSKGAKLYISNSNGFLMNWEKLTGIRIIDSCDTGACGSFSHDGVEYFYQSSRTYRTKSISAKVLSQDENGNPIFTENHYGKGTVYFLNVPFEANRMDIQGIEKGDDWKLYQSLFRDLYAQHVISCDDNRICITEHPYDGGIYAVLVNHSNKKLDLKMRIRSEYEINPLYHGNTDYLMPCDAVVLKLIKK